MGHLSLSLSLSPNEPAGSYISQEDRCCGKQLVLMRDRHHWQEGR